MTRRYIGATEVEYDNNVLLEDFRADVRFAVKLSRKLERLA